MPRHPDTTADSPSTGVARAALLGRDYVDPGAMATALVADGVGLGLARGWRPKPYAYVDPNEDTVGAVTDGTTQLLVVADGHNGHRASHVALDHVLDGLGAVLRPADLTDAELVELVAGVDQAIARAVPRGGAHSRTTLVVALRTRDTLQWVGVGDSALLVVEAMRARQLDTTTRWFCGDDTPAVTMTRTLARGRAAVSPRAWVVLATDGYTDYLPVARPPADATRGFLRTVTAPDRAADVLLRHARRGGAGDNVGLVLSAPW